MKQHSLVINAISLLSKFTGIAKYTYEISRRILPSGLGFDPTYYYGYFRKKLYFHDILVPSPEEKLAKRLKHFISKSYFFKKIAREGLLFSSKFLNRECEVYWEPNNVPIKHIKSEHLVTTVHDFSFHVYPELHRKETREYFKKNFWENILKSDRIITASHFIKDEILNYLHIDPAKVHVINHGIDHDNFKVYERTLLDTFSDLYELPKKYVLFVGSIEPRKNLESALLAYNTLPDAFKKEYKFLLAGFSGWHNAKIMEIICQEKGNIIYLGYLPDRELAYLYNVASAFIYPSIYEGFGLPPIEAMACGSPVIVSRTSSLPEICGDAAYYVDPKKITDIAEGIYTVSTNERLRRDLRKKGLKKAQSFNWEQSAKDHFMVFNGVMGR